MRQIYRKIAKENVVSVAQVKKEMQLAINKAYQNTLDLLFSTLKLNLYG